MDVLNCRTHTGGSRRGRCRWEEVDAALLALIRLVLDDSWSPRRAAEELRAKVPGETILRRVRARVLNALADHPTPVAQRAAATLDEVFAVPDRALLAAGGSR